MPIPACHPGRTMVRIIERDPVPTLKRELARLLVDRLDGWSQENAAHLLRIDQPRISDLRNQRLQRFSLQQLMRFVYRLDGMLSIQLTWIGRDWMFQKASRR